MKSYPVDTFFTLFRDDQPLEVHVEALYSPPIAPRWGSRMEDSEPGEGAEVEILSVSDEDGKEIELTNSEVDDVTEQIIEEQQ
jgi:hypothetical protein